MASENQSPKLKITITLDIPEESIYAGVVTDALEKIALYWDEGARSGDLVCGEGPNSGPVTWDSDAKEE